MYKLSLDSQAANAHVACYFNAVHAALEAIVTGKAVRFWRSREAFDLPGHNGCVRGLFKILLDYTTSESDNLLIAQPDKLWELIKDYNRYIESHYWRIDRSPYKECYKFIEKLFSYDRFAKYRRALEFEHDKAIIKSVEIAKVMGAKWEGNEWSALRFIESLGVRYCPYCNAETVYSITFEKESPIKTARSALDHYFPQSQFPFLAISLCNLVPSCTRCNTNIKRDRELDYTRHMNPYSDSFHDAVKFTCAPDDCAVGFRPDAIHGEDDFHFSIRKRGKPEREDFERRGKAIADFFRIKDIYNCLFRYEAVQDIYRSRIADSSYYDILRRMLGENLADNRLRELFLNVIEDESKINKVRLSKLAIDMHEMVLNSLSKK